MHGSARDCTRLHGSRLELQVGFESAEIGIFRAWVFLLVDVVESHSRSISTSTVLYGCVVAAAAMRPRESRALSTEARAFVPEALRQIWTLPLPPTLVTASGPAVQPLFPVVSLHTSSCEQVVSLKPPPVGFPPYSRQRAALDARLREITRGRTRSREIVRDRTRPQPAAGSV